MEATGLREAFVVDNDAKAEWAIAKIREARADTERWKEHYDHALRQIKEANEATEAYMVELLDEYFQTVPHRTTKTQSSYTLPSGTLVYAKQEPEYIREDEKLLTWVRANVPEFIKTKETVDWDGLKKKLQKGTATIKDTGEIVDGLQVVERPERFKVSIRG